MGRSLVTTKNTAAAESSSSGASPVVVEFLKDNSISKADLEAGVTILSNSSNQTAELQDLTINNPKNKKIIFKNDNFELASVNNSTTLSGKEIVGTGSSITASTDVVAILNTMRRNSSLTSFREITFPTIFEAETQSLDTVYDDIPYQVNLNIYAYFQAEADDGTFYYGSTFGSNQPLRKLNGTRKTGTSYSDVLSSNYYLHTRDATRNYIYSINSSGQVSVTNMTTGQVNTANKSGGNSPDTNYSHAAAIDGYLFYTSGYSNQIVTVVDVRNPSASSYPANNISAGPDPSGVGYAYNLCVAKDKDGRYIVFNGFHSPYYVQAKRFADPMVNTVYDATYYNTSSWSPAPSYQETPGIQAWQTIPNTNGRYSIFYSNASTIYLMDSHAFPNPFYKLTGSQFSTPYTVSSDASLASTDFGTIGIFARGTQTTA